MLIFAGLGNPGPDYAGHRHNIGFMALDCLARRWNAGPWRSKFQGDCAEATIAGARALLIKPRTYMNESGRAVGEAARFHKAELKDVIVFHDELDLAPSHLRVKTGGGNAGHNGLRSITAALGNEYRRVRMGIGHPGDKARVHSYVLSDFAKAEKPWVEDLCRICAEEAGLLAAGDDGHFQSKVHLAMQAAGWKDVKRVGEPSA
jgi:peptidyl-tRNA hydrolase, PTH1 family